MKDLSDWFAAGGTADELNILVEATPALASPPDVADGVEPDEPPDIGQCERSSQSEQLVRLAMDRYRLGVSAEGEPFAIELDGPNIARMLRGNRSSFRVALAREYRRETGHVPNASALSDALTVLEGEAEELDSTVVALRVAAYGDGVVLDLGDSTGRCIVIDSAGWRVEASSPVSFRRTALTGALPVPEPGGDLNELRQLLNLKDSAWALAVGWVIAAMFPNMPHVIPMFGGEHGTGKSWAARAFVQLVDPSPAPLRSEPRDQDAWAMMAAGSWVVALDNVSAIKPWQSDAYCKAVTGDGWVRRQLYTDSALSVLAFRRCIMLTSIDAGALKGDLADRLLLIDLERIAEQDRRTEDDLLTEYLRVRPRLLGALLGVVSGVLRTLPTVKLTQLPRMADFARLLGALDQARPDLTGGIALTSYLQQSGRLAMEVVDSDPVAMAVCRVADCGTWQGTSEDLRLQILPERPPRDWPGTPRALSGRLRRLVPALREVGVAVVIPSTRTNVGRIITIYRADASDPNASGGEGARVQAFGGPPNDQSTSAENLTHNVDPDAYVRQSSRRSPTSPRVGEASDRTVTPPGAGGATVTADFASTDDRGDGSACPSQTATESDYDRDERAGIATDL